MEHSNNKNFLIKFLLDFIPLVIFYGAFKLIPSAKPIIPATACLTIATILSLIIAKVLKVEINKFNIYASIAVIFFGTLTAVFANDLFIKVKITVFSLAFAITFFLGYKLKRPFIKSMFGDAIKIPDKAWLTLSLRFSIYFLVVAILNEIVRHNFSTAAWVNFKFAVIGGMLLFTIIQTPFIMKNTIK